MKGYVYNSSSPSKAEFKNNLALKSLNNGEVLVKVRAAGLNPVDMKLADFPIFNLTLNGKVLGVDFAGVVEETKSSKYKVGDSVYGFTDGSVAEKAIAKDSEINIKPTSISYNEAASLPCVAMTAYQSLLKGDIKEGSKVLVVGASGGCGIIGIQLAKYLAGPTGAVGGICGGQNFAFISNLKACNVLADYKTPDVLLGPTSPLKELGPVDVLFDTVSSSDPKDALNGKPYDKALYSFLAPTGRTVAINGGALRWIRALLFGHEEKNFNMVMCKKSSDDLKVIADIIDKQQLTPIIDSVHPFTAEGVEAGYAKVRIMAIMYLLTLCKIIFLVPLL